jgi:hypothetical protein
MATAALVLPPFVPALAHLIYPSVPLLAAVAEQAGHRATQHDLNRGFMRWLLAPARLRERFSAAAARVAAAHRAERLPASDRAAYGADVRACLAAQFVLRSPDRVVGPDGLPGLRLDGKGDLSSYLAPLFPTQGQDDALLTAFLAEQVDPLLASDPALVGVSVPMGPMLGPALALARLLVEAAGPQGPRVVLGGPCVSLLSEAELARALRQSGAHAFVRFEGEQALLALLAGHERGEVPNLAVLDGDRLHLSPVAAPPSLDHLPTPAYRDEDVAALGDGPLPVIQSRGCHWGRCAYCDYVNLYGDRRYRQASPQALVAQMDALAARHDHHNFQLVTESLPAAYAWRLADALRASPRARAWSTYMRVDPRMDHALAARLGDQGLALATLGVESFDDRILAHVDKGYTGAEAERFLGAFIASSARAWVNLIPDLPTCTAAESLASLAVIERHADRLDGLSAFAFSLTRSSRVGADPARYGLRALEGEGAGYQGFAQNARAYEDPSGMSAADKAAVMARYLSLVEAVNGRERRAREDRWRANLDVLRLMFQKEDVMISQASWPLDVSAAPAGGDPLSPDPRLVLMVAPSGRILQLHPRLSTLLMLVSAGVPFHLGELVEMGAAALDEPPELAAGHARDLVEALMGAGMVTPVIG